MDAPDPESPEQPSVQRADRDRRAVPVIVLVAAIALAASWWGLSDDRPVAPPTAASNALPVASGPVPPPSGPSGAPHPTGSPDPAQGVPGSKGDAQGLTGKGTRPPDGPHAVPQGTRPGVDGDASVYGARIPLPDMVGLAVADARDRLALLGLKTTVKEIDIGQCGSPQPAETVCDTMPSAGRGVLSTTRIILFVVATDAPASPSPPSTSLPPPDGGG